MASEPPGLQDAHAMYPPPAGQRVGPLTHVPALIRELHASPDAVLACAGVSPDDIRDPDARIPYAAVDRMFACASRETDDPQFGLRIGQVWHLDDLGLLGEIVRQSATVGEALKMWTAYHRLNSGGAVAFLAQRASVVDFGYAIYHPDVAAADQIHDAVLAGALNFMRELCGPRFSPSEVFLPHSNHAKMRLYRDVFTVTPHFDSELCALRFPAYWLDRRLESADPERRRAALLRARQAGTPELVQLVYRSLRTLLLAGRSSGDDLARSLGIHRRTLNRRLKMAGTTFQEILDDVRFRVARQLLTDSELSLDDIAASLSYASVTSFMRGFRRWTDTSPGCWRREAQRQRATLKQRVASEPRELQSPPAAIPGYTAAAHSEVAYSRTDVPGMFPAELRQEAWA